MAADYERRDRVHKAELAGRRTRDETRHKPGVDYAVDVIRLPLHQSHNSSQRIRKPMPNNDAKIAANCGVTPEQYAQMSAHTAGGPLVVAAYVDEDATASALMGGAWHHLGKAQDPNDDQSIDARLDQALDMLKRAKALRAASKTASVSIRRCGLSDNTLLGRWSGCRARCHHRGC